MIRDTLDPMTALLAVLLTLAPADAPAAGPTTPSAAAETPPEEKKKPLNLKTVARKLNAIRPPSVPRNATDVQLRSRQLAVVRAIDEALHGEPVEISGQLTGVQYRNGEAHLDWAPTGRGLKIGGRNGLTFHGQIATIRTPMTEAEAAELRVGTRFTLSGQISIGWTDRRNPYDSQPIRDDRPEVTAETFYRMGYLLVPNGILSETVYLQIADPDVTF